MIKSLPSCLFILAMFTGSAAQANVEIKFTESAPKDRFVIENTSKCDLNNMTLEIDLSQSAGRLIFDTTATGAGVEVFQPFEVTEGASLLTSPESGTSTTMNGNGVSSRLQLPGTSWTIPNVHASCFQTLPGRQNLQD